MAEGGGTQRDPHTLWTHGYGLLLVEGDIGSVFSTAGVILQKLPKWG